MMTKKTTIVVLDRHCYLTQRLEMANHRRHGTQIMMINELAVRLAGGFVQTVNPAFLRATIQEVLPNTDLGSLNGIKDLPGFVGTATNTINKVWLSGFDLNQSHHRVREVAHLNHAVSQRMPPSMLPPESLIEAACKNIHHARIVLGSVSFIGMTELHPCWWRLVELLSEHVPVTWNAGPRHVPSHLPSRCKIQSESQQTPSITAVSCSTPFHECVEAMRWARHLVSNQNISPSDIAIASTDTKIYDDFFLTLREESDLPLYFAHGVNLINRPHGQAVVALADLLLRGISSDRIHRLCTHQQFLTNRLQSLGKAWWNLTNQIYDLHMLAQEQIHLRVSKQVEALENADDNPVSLVLSQINQNADYRLDQNPQLNLMDHIDMKQSWLKSGEQILAGAALQLWTSLLKVSPATSIEQEILKISVPEPPEFSERVAWMPARSLAASPRPYVRLLGLNSYRWPRENMKDLLLTGPGLEYANQLLDPLPISDADQRDFSTICKTTSNSILCSFARYDADGKVLGHSHLLHSDLLRSGTKAFRNSTPVHAMSTSDWTLASPAQFKHNPVAVNAYSCWKNWRSDHITEHDGLVQKNHPLILHLLKKPASATSLTRMLRSPLGFVWHYGLKWRGIQPYVDPLKLNPMNYGSLVHLVLQSVLQNIESHRKQASDWSRENLIAQAIESTCADWESLYGIPPKLLWEDTMKQITHMTNLVFQDYHPGESSQSFAEVPFGSSEGETLADVPWDPNAPVTLTGTSLRMTGTIDRLDLDLHSKSADLTDYKSGKPLRESGLKGGRELQRCIYFIAASSLLKRKLKISTSLFYLQNGHRLPLPTPQEEFVGQLSQNVNEAIQNFHDGYVLFGAIPKQQYDLGIYMDLQLALPADLFRGYLPRKQEDLTKKLGLVLTEFWEED